MHSIVPRKLYHWTHDRDVILEAMWRGGTTCSKIAQHFGDVTRNAVIGRLHRLGLNSKHQPYKRHKHKTVTPQPHRIRGSAISLAARAELAEFFLPYFVPLRDDEQAPSEKGVWLLNLEPHHCRWPLGEPRAMLFCGCNRQDDNSAYCSYHHRRAHRADTHYSMSGKHHSARTKALLSRLARQWGDMPPFPSTHLRVYK